MLRIDRMSKIARPARGHHPAPAFGAKTTNALGCVGGVFSGWDDDFKECVTNKIIKDKYFAEAYRRRLLKGLNGKMETVVR